MSVMRYALFLTLQPAAQEVYYKTKLTFTSRFYSMHSFEEKSTGSGLG